MELERRSSGVAKGGLTTGIIGTSLGALNSMALLGTGAGALGNLFGRNAGYNEGCGATVVPVPVPMGGYGYGCDGYGYGRGGRYGDGGNCCSDNVLVNRYELNLQQQIAEKDSQIALRDANTYSDQKSLALYQYVDGRLRDIESKICNQEVENQAVRDSFQLVRQEQQCCCDKLDTAINNEAKERRCNDNILANYMNATFYPKYVADVTTAATTTRQAVYNPLPCECGCGNNNMNPTVVTTPATTA